MSAPALPDKVVAIDVALTEGSVPHAFGGALALAFYAEPRSTIDIDVNVFVAPSETERVEAALSPLGVEATQDPTEPRHDGQCRWWWERTPVDIFFAYDAIHTAMAAAVVRVPFGKSRIPILAAEHLLICKLAFDRPKDWLDIEQMLILNPDLDRAEVELWAARLAGADDPRLQRLAELWARSGR